MAGEAIPRKIENNVTNAGDAEIVLVETELK